MHLILIVLVSLFASVIGAIAGIGGGVIIKPVLDSLGIMEVSTISFLSGCTVLSMSTYNAARSLLSGDRQLKKEIAFPLGIGAAIGGVLGKYLFSLISSLFENTARVGAVQSACLLVITVLTLVYTLKPSFPSRVFSAFGVICAKFSSPDSSCSALASVSSTILKTTVSILGDPW